MEEWQKLKAKWREGFIPADRSGYYEAVKAQITDLWRSRPHVQAKPIWQYRWWWLKNWTMAVGTGIAMWQASLLLARPTEPVRIDDVMTMIPTLHAAIWKMVVRDIGRPMEMAKDPRVYHYFGYFMDARPQGVPYEVSVTDEWSFMTLRKPSKMPPPPPSGEFTEPFLEEAGIYPSEPEHEDQPSLPTETEWTFSPWSHEHILTLKFYVHSLRKLVFDLYEDAGYDVGYSIQPYNWNRVTAVLTVPEDGSSEPYKLRSVTIYDRLHDCSLVWSEDESYYRLFKVSSYDTWRWSPTGVPTAAPTLEYDEVLRSYMPRWATRKPDAEGLAMDSGWSVNMFQAWPRWTAKVLSTETGRQNEEKLLPAEYDDLYDRIKPGDNKRLQENMKKMYKPSPTGKWAYEYPGLSDIK